MRLGSLYLLFFVCISCQEITQTPSDLKFYPIKKESFSQYINDKKMPSKPNLNEDKYIINRDYPIEISLYNNGTWYYNLDNLGEGKGTWVYKNGRLELFAQRDLFDMYIDIQAIKEDASEIIIQFSDRFGPRTLKVEKRNFQVH